MSDTIFTLSFYVLKYLITVRVLNVNCNICTLNMLWTSFPSQRKSMLPMRSPIEFAETLGSTHEVYNRRGMLLQESADRHRPQADTIF